MRGALLVPGWRRRRAESPPPTPIPPGAGRRGPNGGASSRATPRSVGGAHLQIQHVTRALPGAPPERRRRRRGSRAASLAARSCCAPLHPRSPTGAQPSGIAPHKETGHCPPPCPPPRPALNCASVCRRGGRPTSFADTRPSPLQSAPARPRGPSPLSPPVALAHFRQAPNSEPRPQLGSTL